MSSRVVAVTGTSRGLGRALSEELCQLGHTTYGCGRTALDQLEPQPSFGYRSVDVTDAAALRSWFQGMEEQPDIVVANAGLINGNAPLWEVPEEEFRRVVEVNLTGVFLTFKTFLQNRAEDKPVVLVALSSGWGRSASAEVAPYCATKWGVEGMVKALAQELPRQDTVVALNPGIVFTDMLASCFGGAASGYETPGEWAGGAAAQILAYSRSDNGGSLTV